MPTRHERIAVTKDPELAAALDRVRALTRSDAPAATVVRDLALRGAQALIDDDERRRQLRIELAEMSVGDNPPWDREVLADIDRLAWGQRD